MKQLAVLGPKGTYASLAALKLENSYEICYYPTILSCFEAVNDDTDALIPFENTLDGFVMEALDAIIRKPYYMVEEVKLPVGFHFVSFLDSLNEIQSVYVQHKTYGQCLQFILKNQLRPIITQSNMESLNSLVSSKEPHAGAIIPSHLATKDFPLVCLNVADSKENETRFVRISLDHQLPKNKRWVVSMTITPVEDRVGILFSILEIFAQLKLNLRTILSRPRRDMIGKYIFYIEIDLLKKDNLLLEEAKKLIQSKNCTITILGIYNQLEEEL